MHRRRHGEGSVYRRSDGRWEARLRLPDGRRKSIYESTRRRAISRLSDAGWRVDHGLPLQAARRTLGEYLKYWLEVTRRRVRPTTFEAYELSVRRLLPPDRISPTCPPWAVGRPGDLRLIASEWALIAQCGADAHGAAPSPLPSGALGPDRGQPDRRDER